MFHRLRQLLVDDYGALKRKLARRLGSQDVASEVLHEAWLRLDRLDSTKAGIAVRNPPGYLYGVAMNVAADRLRQDRRWLDKIEIEAICRRAADDLNPARIVEARSELMALTRALEALPPLRRAIFIASRIEELPHRAIAERHAISVRAVDRELKAALAHFGAILDKKAMPRRGPRPQDVP
ncbi:RNA polymerase sigma factor [Reyranella sp. CPCC 100927]|uniref:RNA polymerase sigma factor n=1 Tax=Reyranella sp. CPCC 100927 TaxID=2599616 RepID=UPI0011B3A6B7|nr:RNA polymerase sigma factor [Reyranella sp. CPCC 100927]TWT13052.1 RNA polymerase sigma factor [Reyranella sp. CPCC 100927]